MFLMKLKKKWFTLLEIIIVISIIVIIMTITMKFSGSRIKELEAQTGKDDFKNNYEQLLLSNMSSNYNGEERYTALYIKIETWSHWFDYRLEQESWDMKLFTWFSDSKQIIKEIKINNQTSNIVDIKLLPYTIGCKINDQEGITKIKTEIRNKIYCFKITTNICKLEYIPCSSF